ncbi:MAG: hypothetical protein JXQ65_01940 [Candidatus Marinimicrobia bacterium]|nr:hypothetical protein [Candidatus Neomarinimicrobiota bacterium]
MNKNLIVKGFLLILMVNSHLCAQGRPYEGPNDPAGDVSAIREGRMTGNRVLLYFKNTTELAYWPNYDHSKWPNDESGVGMIDGIGLNIAGKIYLRNDSIPVTDPNEIKNNKNDLQKLYYCETNYRQGMDHDRTGTIVYGLYPVPGYANNNNEYVAMSNREDSWPAEGWPATGFEKKWPGEWNGRFGRGVKYASLETFFVANDAQDLEYIKDTTIAEKYYPRRKYDSNSDIIEDIRIGDVNPNVTIQKGEPWGGLGTRVNVRGYQWNNLQTRDVIFWEYDISNISFYDITEIAFGYWVDMGVGHLNGIGESDDIGYFNQYIDMAYCWDTDGVGVEGRRTGLMAFAFLESPGIHYDGIDNDEDGIIDENRDNQALTKVSGGFGIYDPVKYEAWYGKPVSEIGEHWDADEDGDWQDGFDANGNGIYDNGEYYGNDVGLDGVGPNDLNYFGPDEGECNHKPDFVEGVGCEPNFAATDISESDMMGLTSFHQFHHPQTNEPPFSWADDGVFHIFASRGLDEFFGELANLIFMFGSGLFKLEQGRTERISMAELHSYDPLSGLNSESHTAPSLTAKRGIVQLIYENDYRFAKPPVMPALSAEPLDGKVILTWDDVADKFTREPLINSINDFEGYKIYRATDKYFSDAEVLVDMYGNPAGMKPIFQCDKKNGRKGAADYAVVSGESYYLGDDSGIQHYFIDTDVQNGRTYYYAVVAYDYGIPAEELSGFGSVDASIYPAENNVVIELNEDESIRQIGKNVAIVTPKTDAAGYQNPNVSIDYSGSKGTGKIEPIIYNEKNVKYNHRYKLKFDVLTTVYLNVFTFRIDPEKKFVNTGFSVYDTDDNDRLVYYENHENSDYAANYIEDAKSRQGFWADNNNKKLDYVRLKENDVYSDVFDGIRLNISDLVQTPVLDTLNTGWLNGDFPIHVKVNADSEYIHYPYDDTTLVKRPAEALFFPYVYEIRFDDEYTGKFDNSIRQNFYSPDGKIIRKEQILLGETFPFYVVNTMLGDTLDLFGVDVNGNGAFDLFQDEILAGYIKYIFQNHSSWAATILKFSFYDETNFPVSDAIYQINFKRPFLESDSIMFIIHPPEEATEEGINEDMKKIKVVPNPYVATNAMETAVSNIGLNQRCKIMFTHIPARCEINIFTATGVFIDKIKVDNEPNDGKVYWDLLTRENLEIAAGVYVYHVKSDVTSKEKIGKFAVLK